ncbi:hypothetical protein [Cohnella sp. GCM10012308]|uniref:hypothetical protein n=1 Tax=Cohnella sp. GCM10012308 TaxID=3317329 RepID=UPI00361D5945
MAKFIFMRPEQFEPTGSPFEIDQPKGASLFMNKLIQSVMQRSVIILIFVVLIVAWGGVAAFQMQRDYMPGITNTTLMVSLRASAYQVHQVQTDPGSRSDRL